MKDFKVDPIRHGSAMEIAAEYLGYDWPLSERDAVGFMDLKIVEDRTVTVASRVRELNVMGYWAFCRRAPAGGIGELHYWVHGRISRERLVSVFAHELAHLIGYGDETTAIKIACVAGFAYVLAKQSEDERRHVCRRRKR